MDEYVIYELNYELFWSNEDGWVSFESATIFNSNELVGVHLVGNWIWVRIKEV